ncbi:MAG: hypothetical protein IPK59_21940 [Rhodospirillaceae bacterium]|nr:hypothetical protein [Rhodospirillaceae bacterium]
MKQDRTLFRPRQLLALIMVGLTAFIGFTYLMIFGENLISAGSDTFSHSAIGHKAFQESLQRLGIPVSISRFQSLEKAGAATLLVLAEPDNLDHGTRPLDALKGEEIVLVVLPKWQGRASISNPEWLRQTKLIDVGDVTGILTRVVPGASLVRAKTGAPYESGLGYTPAVSQMQLMRSDALSPVVAYEQGMLIGEIRVGRAKVWLLSDPDIIANAGIGKGDNAPFAVAMIRALLPAGGSVMFDETIHGFEQPPNMLRMAFELPFLTATVAFAVATLTAILAGITRLGAPAPAAPPLAAGRETLLRNIAELLEYGRGAPAIMVRYPRLVVADVAQRLKVPKALDESGQVAWLDRRARKLGLSLTASDLLAQGAPLARHGDRGVAELGRLADQWKQEMLHGTRRRAID